MYAIGDRIVYPMHGAGIVRAVEEKEIFGVMQQYYAVDVVSERMEILIPVDKAEAIGVRNVLEEAELKEVLLLLREPSEDVTERSWNKRFQSMMDQMKTGKLSDAARVLRNLTRKERKKGLSAGEKKMLMTARNFFASEMVMIREITKEEAIQLIDDLID